MQECLLHLSQEVSSLGLQPVWTASGGGTEINVVSLLNCTYDLIQLHHKSLRSLENLEVENLRSSSNMDSLQLIRTRLKEQLEVSKRENTGLLERERGLLQQVKSLQNALKNEKEEVHRLQSIIANRASQYNHEMRRKEREFNKLKERLNQLLVDRKDKKQAIDVLNSIGRANGKRSLWKTEKTEAKHEGEMYKTLLSDYESRQKELLQENAEFNRILQQMKKDMVFILRSKKAKLKDASHDEDSTQPDSGESEEASECSKERVELFCVGSCEELTNSICLKWRQLKSHVERLDSEVSSARMVQSKTPDSVLKDPCEEEMDTLKLELQHCKDFIQTQQQLLQQQLSCQCDEETAPVLSNCVILQEKERLGQEWRRLEEQRSLFERERRKFTEAAIRLGEERKAFEEDRAVWLKDQFLNLAPVADLQKPPLSKSKSAFLITETNATTKPAPKNILECTSESRRPSAECASLTASSTAAARWTPCLIPAHSTESKTEHAEESSVCSNGLARVQSQRLDECQDCRGHTLCEEWVGKYSPT